MPDVVVSVEVVFDWSAVEELVMLGVVLVVVSVVVVLFVVVVDMLPMSFVFVVEAVVSTVGVVVFRFALCVCV